MKLYNKQLNSVEELRLEKQKLKAEIKKADATSFFSIDDIIPGTKPTTEKEAPKDIMGMATNILSSLANKETLLAVGMPLLSILTGGVQKAVVKKVLKEVGLGYIKWKAVELGYKGVKTILKKTTEKRAKNR